MSFTQIAYKDEIKRKPKKHYHFCKRCWEKWQCEIELRKDCSLTDGVYCDKCLSEKIKENGE